MTFPPPAQAASRSAGIISYAPISGKAKYDRRALVPLPPFMTSIAPIGSCNTNCTARMTNARLSLVNTQHNV